jgi:hypothetical protein
MRVSSDEVEHIEDMENFFFPLHFVPYPYSQCAMFNQDKTILSTDLVYQ